MSAVEIMIQMAKNECKPPEPEGEPTNYVRPISAIDKVIEKEEIPIAMSEEEEEISIHSEQYLPSTEKESDFRNLFCKKLHEDGFRSVTILKNGAKIKTEYYVTKNIFGYPIRNAITGSIYPHYRVGSGMEYLFFKVNISSGQSNIYVSNLYQTKKNTKQKIVLEKEDPDVLFYDCPEDFETHRGVSLSQDLKNVWRERYNRLLAYLAKVEQARIEKQRYTHNAKVMVQ